MDRRTAIGLGLAGVVLAARAAAQTAPQPRLLPGDGSIASDPTEIVPLWPGTPPGGEGLRLTNRMQDYSADPAHPDRSVDQIGTPSLTVFRPERPDGSAMVLAPGGGYRRETLDDAPFELARRLVRAGITVFVLRYRLPGEGWANRSDVPLQDAQRAMRLVRAGAARYGVDPARLGFMGFSAGGHVGASLITRGAAAVYAPLDEADRLDPAANFACLMYPVVTMGPGAHQGCHDNLLGASPTAEQVAFYSCERHVTAAAPPTFLALAADDPIVRPFENGIALFGALRAAGVASELHVFEVGGHGFGITKVAGKPASAWPDLFLRWGAAHGFFRTV